MAGSIFMPRFNRSKIDLSGITDWKELVQRMTPPVMPAVDSTPGGLVKRTVGPGGPPTATPPGLSKTIINGPPERPKKKTWTRDQSNWKDYQLPVVGQPTWWNDETMTSKSGKPKPGSLAVNTGVGRTAPVNKPIKWRGG